MLIDMYRRGEIASWDELIYRVKSAGKEFAKGAVEGAAVGATGMAGGVGAKALLGAAAKTTGVGAVALKGTAKAMPVGSEILGLTTASALVDGHVPTANDFAENAGMIIGLRGMHKVSGAAYNRMRNQVVDKLYERWIENGENPKDVMNKAMHDPLELQDILAERQQIKKGYKEVLENPLKGTIEGKDDILATMRPNELTEYIINRGAAIKDPKTGDIIVQGDDLAKATGTKGNFGFSKMIFKHGTSVEDAMRVPEILREYNPYKTSHEKENYRIPVDEKENLLVVFGKNGAGQNRLITVFREKKDKNNIYSTKKPLNVVDNSGAISTTTTQTAGDAATGSQRPIKSIAEKGGAVKGSVQSPGGGDYVWDIYSGGTRIAMPGEKPVTPEVRVAAEEGELLLKYEYECIRYHFTGIIC